jgi:proteic killer suppression protein
MIISFRDQGTEDIFQGKLTKRALKKCPKNLIKKAVKKLVLHNTNFDR